MKDGRKRVMMFVVDVFLKERRRLLRRGEGKERERACVVSMEG
jgi:hypothetical protein